MIVVALSTALTGILLLGLGLARAGGAIRFVPYPVIGGFLSATGWLMVSGAVRVITDHGLSLSTLERPARHDARWHSSRPRRPSPSRSISCCAAREARFCYPPSCSSPWLLRTSLSR